MKTLSLLLFIFSSFLGFLSADGLDPFSLPSAKANSATKAKLLSEVTTIAPGKPFTVALKLAHPDGWHSYYVNTGIVGNILEVEWELPEGFQVQYQGWPTPHLSTAFGLQAIGYEHTIYHLYQITPPSEINAGSNVAISLKANWQICDEKSCKDENLSQTLDLKVADEPATDEQFAKDFTAARKHYPVTGKVTVKAFEADSIITLKISPAGNLNVENLQFFDEDGQVSVQDPQEATKDGDTLTLKVARNQGNDFAEAGPVLEELKGILSDGKESHFVQTSFMTAPVETAPVSFSSLMPILAGMFFGGLILNLMPCVFPVIGIKIMGFVDQAGHDRKKVMMHGLAFAGGVFASFWLLTLIMLLGGIKNWGGQLENPYVMFTLIIVMLLLAMNMYGVFEIGSSATGVGSNLTRKDGLSGSFFSGVLATVVATPCSAPFLGAALGAAVALPTFWFIFAFTVMAAGLSLPYLTLSAFPNLVKKLPRPGAWMESFKQGMSFLLFATVGYLLWVYSAQVFEQDYGQKGLFVMIGLSLIASAGWVWGRWTTPIRKPKTKWIARGLTLSLFLAGFVLAKPGKDLEEGNTVAIEWEKWSKEKEQKYLAEGRPVYIDFTAKWCLTCQVNKKNAYTQEVVDLMNRHDVVFMKADKTTKNDEIDSEITRLKRSAIPVNVLYSPEEKKPVITPEVLTPGYMIDLINDNLGKLPSQAFNEENFEEALASGDPVLVNFRSDW